MAIKHFKSYPHFVANQVLKSSDLNNSFGFLDEQARLSRLHLVGQGIISGLDVSVGKGLLKVSKGVAVDNGGWVVQLPEDTEYRYVASIPYSEEPFDSDSLESLVANGGSRIEYICFKTKDDAMELGLSPVAISSVLTGNHLVALAYGTRRELSNRCSHESCDVNVTSLLVEAWPVIVKPKSPLFMELKLVDKKVFPPLLPELRNISKIKFANNIIVDSFLARKTDVVQLMHYIFEILLCQNFVRQGSGKNTFSTRATPWDNVFSDSRRLFGRFYASILKIEGLYTSGTGSRPDFVPDYLLSFLGDMQQAIAEFVEAYNEYAAETIRIPDWIPGDRLSYLGKLPKADARYRSYFREADAVASNEASMKLERLLWRVCVLSQEFIGTTSARILAAKSLNISAVRPGARLSDRPIPFYYTAGEELRRSWNADKSSSYRNLCDYDARGVTASQKTSLLTCAGGMDFYLEAYQYKKVDAVVNFLSNNRSLSWMNLTVKNIPLRNIGRLTPAQFDFLNSYFAVDAFKTTYAPQIREKGSDKVKDLVGYLECIWAVVGNSTQRVKDEMQQLRKGNGFCSSFMYPEAKKIKSAMEELWEMTRIFKEVAGIKYNDKRNKFADPIYSSFLNLFNIIRDSVTTEYDLSKAVFCGPIRPGSTVCLVSEDDKVIYYAVFY